MKYKFAIKVALVIVALVFAYLFALNGRYMTCQKGYIYDKWTGLQYSPIHNPIGEPYNSKVFDTKNHTYKVYQYTKEK